MDDAGAGRWAGSDTRKRPKLGACRAPRGASSRRVLRHPAASVGESTTESAGPTRLSETRATRRRADAVGGATPPALSEHVVALGWGGVGGKR
nr:unnamed protein product [Digitaria exilis]